MKKVVLIAEPIEKGIGRHIIDLYKNFQNENDCEITVLYGTKRLDKNYKEVLASGNNYEIKNFSDKLGFNDIKSFFEIRKILKQIKPDVVHCHGSKAGLEGRFAAKTLGIKKIIYSPHAYFFLKFDKNSFKRKMFIFAEKFLSRFFTYKTVTTSKGEDNVFEENNIDKNSKKVLIEHGIDVPQIDELKIQEERKKYQIKDNEILIGAMARFAVQKDPIGTFKIMQKISEKKPNVKCIFWGNGDLYDEVNKLNEDFSSKIILAGESKQPDVSLKALDIYLTASLYEGLPYTLLESLALGKTIVASNVEGNKDCVFENENGALFEVHNYDEAVSKIENIILENKIEEFGKKSFEIYKNRFSVSKMIENYKQLYIEEK
jgi:glycosyltransferase involved in cell wall biosynthesis